MSTAKPRKEITWFASEMEAKLRENDHKGHWADGNTVEELLPRIMDERDELLLAVHGLDLDGPKEKLSSKDACEIIRECADIANFAMMIADLVRMKRVQIEEGD